MYIYDGPERKKIHIRITVWCVKTPTRLPMYSMFPFSLSLSLSRACMHTCTHTNCKPFFLNCLRTEICQGLMVLNAQNNNQLMHFNAMAVFFVINYSKNAARRAPPQTAKKNGQCTRHYKRYYNLSIQQ